MRDDGRAVLLVDHNVKSVAALVDRVFAMYVGERIAEGTADEVMRDETVRRVYLGGSIETAARPESSFRDKTPFLEVENLSVFTARRRRSRTSRSMSTKASSCRSSASTAPARPPCSTPSPACSRYSGEIRRDGKALGGLTPAAIARGGIVQCPEGRELFGDMTVRENLDLGGQHVTPAESEERMDWLFDLFPILKRSARARRPARSRAASSRC